MINFKQETDNNSLGLIRVAYKYRKPLIIVCILAALVSSGVSLLIPPKYKSSIILFPTSSSSVSQALVTESQQKKEILSFGEEEDVEQLMQVLLSTEIRNRIIEKHNLFEHYKLDENTAYPNTTLYGIYAENVSVSRTKYMSVRVDVLDEDPEMAAIIANDIANLVDSTYNRIQKERAQKAFDIVAYEFGMQKEKIQQIQDSLQALSILGVIDVKSQTEMYTEQYAIALSKNNFASAAKVEQKLNIIAKYGSIQTILKEQMYEEVKNLAVIEAKYREAKIDLEQDLPNKYVVDKAEKAEKKSYPVRSMIVVVSVMASFLFAFMLLLVFEQLKKEN